MSCKYIITRYYNYSTAVFLSFFLQDFNKDVVHYNYNNNNTNSKYSESSCTEDFLKWPLPVCRWRLVIHGGIDRYSCLVVYLECSEEQQRWDQREFASEEYCWPSRVRTGKGRENAVVAGLTIERSCIWTVNKVQCIWLIRRYKFVHYKQCFNKITIPYFYTLLLLIE